jgi:hypothetical protein
MGCVVSLFLLSKYALLLSPDFIYLINIKILQRVKLANFVPEQLQALFIR